MKVIYVSAVPLTDSHAQDTFVYYLQTQNVDMEYWDVSIINRKDCFLSGSINFSFVKKIKSIKNFSENVKKNQSSLFIIQMSYVGAYVELYRILTAHRCSMVSMSWGELPYYPHQGRLQRFALALSYGTFLSQSKGIFYKMMNLVKSFDMSFVAGNHFKSGYNGKTEIVQISSPDYEKHKKRGERFFYSQNGKYAVFLDQYLPFHSDRVKGGVNAERYYAVLNDFFLFVEQKKGVEIVIAAHPKYNDGDDLFKGRRVFRFSTSDLVRYSDFVIAHYSTSINFAILENKPLVFVSTRCMNDSFINRFQYLSKIHDCARYFDLPVYNIDDMDKSNFFISEVNNIIYEKFKYEFLTSRDVENESSSEIFFRGLKRLHDKKQRML